MITNNIDIADGLVNGAIGILRRIDFSHAENNPTVVRVWLEFDNDSIGKEARESVKQYCTKQNIPLNWIPINYLKHSIKIGRSVSSIIVRRMFPQK